MNNRRFCSISATLLFVVFIFVPLSRVDLSHSTSNSPSTADMESFAQQFLTSVVAFDTSDYQITFASTSGEPPLPTYSTTHFENVCSATISNSQGQFSAMFSFIDGKFSWFNLANSEGNPEVSTKQDFNSWMNSVIRALDGYQSLSNATYCTDFANLAKTALQEQELTVENENFSLQIQNTSTYWTATCYSKIGGNYSSPFRSLSISISGTGLVTDLYDGMSIYYVATTNVTVSEDQAIARAKPLIEGYAQKHQQKVTAVNATFEYSLDRLEQRGDTCALYPEWDIEASYDKVDENGTYGYSVFVWADNGQIASAGPDALMCNCLPASTNGPFDLRLLFLPCAVVVFALAFGVYLHRRPRVRSEVADEDFGRNCSFTHVSLALPFVRPICLCSEHLDCRVFLHTGRVFECGARIVHPLDYMITSYADPSEQSKPATTCGSTKEALLLHVFSTE
jgi:hypothetical protein